MASETFEDLLKRMPEIARAVNGFTSESIQREAFEALMRAAGVTATEPETMRPTGDGSGGELPASPAASSSTKRKPAKKTTPKGRKSAAQAPTVVGDLNLRPSGKESFKDFVVEKKPVNVKDQNLLCVYYLKHELGIAAVNVNHVFTCYREMKDSWKLPSNLRNSLQVTASTTGYLGTSSMEDITLNATGTNRVEHDLPPKPKK